MPAEARTHGALWPNEEAAAPLDARTLSLLVKLAALLARPLSHVDASRCAMEPLPPAAVTQMAKLSAFERPVNHALARKLGFDELDFNASFVARLQAEPRVRLATLIVTAARDIIDEVALTCAAAALHRIFVRVVLKGERDAIRAALGDSLFQLSVREAAAFCSSLGESALRPQDWTGLFAREAKQQRELLNRFGLHFLCAFLDATAPALAAVFMMRFNQTLGLDHWRESVVTMSDVQGEQTTRLLRRRLRAWTDIIS